jgi:hypothetical protein
MKKNKLIKIMASISTMGAIGAGTVIGISSCGVLPPSVVKPLSVGTEDDTIFTFEGSKITGINPDSETGKDMLTVAMTEGGYNALIFNDTINAIGNNVFLNCTVLKNSQTEIPITFLNPAITLIDSSAFYSCASIKQINLAPNTIIYSIGSMAFLNCTNLIGFGDNASTATITTINDTAFGGCPNLTVAGIKDMTVGGCTKTTDTANGVC